ncbi:hypothetical protein ISN44_As03g034750 [Arabidopsis suecica]|uniref:Uncharacterized protein n=1 Tax=Arabidopsis suecica TaxID=45249 RepID=A0A8T2FAD4_ARASU|nr:hypothetical protein ISN44_As03g034750 [Arabidopsis suecica]
MSDIRMRADIAADGLTDRPPDRLADEPAEELSDGLPEGLSKEPADELADSPFLLDEPPDHFEDFLLFIFTLMKTTSCLGVAKTTHKLFLCVEPTKEKVAFFDKATSFSAPIEILLLKLEPPSIPGYLRRPLSPKDSHISSTTIIDAPLLKPNG